MIETVRLASGATVLAHRLVTSLAPTYYDTRTQALQRIAALKDVGITTRLYHPYRLFYVRIDA